MHEDGPRVHPDAAAHDELKAQQREDLDKFGTTSQNEPEFNENKARERLALLLTQIHARRWDVTPDEYAYNLADEFIGILRIGES